MIKTSVVYTALTPQHFDAVIALGNQVQGENYLSQDSLSAMYEKGQHNNINASLVALIDDQIAGFRLTYAPAHWDIDKWCTPGQWGAPADQVCYFKCNTVAPDKQGLGIGSTLLAKSIEAAKKQGAVAGLAHIWLASPGNSAFRYFSKNGGELIHVHPDKWREAAIYDGYDCPVCIGLCRCEGGEMLLRF